MDKPHPYFENHQTGYEQYFKENPQDVEMQKLCHDVFINSESGQKLYALIQERYIIPGLYAPEHPHVQSLAIYFEGFKEAFRGLDKMAKIHQQRICR